jgi:hypothetical protein
VIGPALGTDRDVVAAAVIAAIDQHIADVGCAHFAQGVFLRVGGHDFTDHAERSANARTQVHKSTPLGLKQRETKKYTARGLNPQRWPADRLFSAAGHLGAKKRRSLGRESAPRHPVSRLQIDVKDGSAVTNRFGGDQCLATLWLLDNMFNTRSWAFAASSSPKYMRVARPILLPREASRKFM